MGERLRQQENSGQILLIAAFIIASLLLSAQLYVMDVGKTISETEADSLNDFIFAIKLGSNNVVTGSLANISNGGQINVLMGNLQRWSDFIGGQYQFGKNVLNYALGETALYSAGVWTYWGTGGFGVSSAYTDFTYKLSDREVELDQTYPINITTTLLVESTCQTLTGNEKQVNVTINVLNEANSALANEITVYYKSTEGWLAADTANNYTFIGFGNGTYTVSFQADIPSETVEVSAHVVDQRGIYVRTNATGTHI